MFAKSQISRARISATLVVSLALVSMAGCNRDPNVRKHKYLESGKRYAAAGKYKEAVIQFSNAIKVDHDFADAHYELAKTYLNTGSMLPAYSELLKTVDLDPSNLSARITFANVLLAGNATDRAEEQAKAVLAINPDYPDALAVLAEVAQHKGDTPGALKD